MCNGLGTVIADRSPRAWAVFAVVGTVVVVLARQLALLPLGQAHAMVWMSLLRSALLTGAWCGLVGWVLQMNLPARWQQYRQQLTHRQRRH